MSPYQYHVIANVKKEKKGERRFKEVTKEVLMRSAAYPG